MDVRCEECRRFKGHDRRCSFHVPIGRPYRKCECGQWTQRKNGKCRKCTAGVPSQLDSLKDFARQWWESRTLTEVCERTGMDRREASNTAANMRRQGFKMKHMPRDIKKVALVLAPDERSDLREFCDLLAANEQARVEAERYRKRRAS